MGNKTKFENLAVFIFLLSILLHICMTEYIDSKIRDQAVAEYESDGGSCYVDGIKQNDSFDIHGINLDNYTISYEDGKLYLKTQK